jgi:ELWxxDGT repeat protein
VSLLSRFALTGALVLVTFFVPTLVIDAPRAQIIERLADIETGAGPQVSSFPAGFFNNESVTLPNGSVMFAASDPEHGRELWLSTGSSAVLVRDIEPGPGNGAPGAGTVFDGRVWFSATTTDSGAELWVSDGSPAGTRRFADLNPGTGGSSATVIGILPSPSRLLIAANDADGRALYTIAPGATQATRLSSGIGACPSVSLAGRSAVLGTQFLFAGTDGTACELYVTDGTEAGTLLVADIDAATAASPQRFIRVGAQVLFVASTAALGRELWSTDGTAGNTRNVADLASGPANGDPGGFQVRNDALIFHAREGSGVRRLNRTDGVTVETLLPTAAYSVTDADTATLGSEVCFAANDGTTGTELWCTDGTTVGTRRVADLAAGSASANPQGLFVATIAAGQRLFFTTNVPATGATRFAITDGTTPGTTFLTPIGLASSSVFFAQAGSQVLARASLSAPNDVELWRSDGSPAGTGLLADIGAAPGGSLVSRFVVSADGSQAWFAAFSSATGYELWRTNGTIPGTSPVIDLLPGATSGLVSDGFSTPLSAPDRALSFGERLLFIGNDGSGEEPWISDGSAAGTVRLADTLPGNNATGAVHFGIRGESAYFLARVSTSTSSLARVFRTDGTPQGTSELVVPTGSRFIGPWMRAGEHLYIAGVRSSDGQELWRVNDAGDSLEPVADLASGPADLQITGGIALGDALIFAGTKSPEGRELYRSDGTASGTALIADVGVGTFISSLDSLLLTTNASGRRNTVAFGSRVLYACDPSGLSRFEPCVTDGTLAGTGVLIDLQPGAASSLPTEPVADATRAWFIATNSTGRAVFVTDGTTASVEPLAETQGIAPADLALLPNGELVMSGNFVLGATDFGREVFAGRPGSVRGFNLAAGELGSSPVNVARVGNFAVFRANAGAAGNEPFVYKPDHIGDDGFE